jgi:hypothetical protein
VGLRFSAPVQTGPRAHPASCTMGTGSFPGVKSGQRVTLNPHPFLVPWSRKSRAIPLLPLWAVRPVQSLSACTWVHFTLPMITAHLNNTRSFLIVVRTPYSHSLDHVFDSNAKEKCLLMYFSVCAVRYCNRV